MSEQRKIRSVLDLARYRVGDVAWWVVLRPIKALPDLADDQQWMLRSHVHPKVLYKNDGPYAALWPRKAVLPKLQHMDFASVVSLLTSELTVEQFPVCDLVRSRDTADFYFSNDDGEWILEAHLMDTKIAADRERSRILRLIRKWAEGLK